jgi:Fe2+ or Zn2+ uptake regulation protein
MINAIDNIGDFLKSHEIKPSFQRIRIYEYLLNHRVHPTVDDIYRSLVVEIPTLSKTTVYNTLNLFIEKKITQLITIEENEARYDSLTSVHGHFKCEKCEKVYDFETDIAHIDTSEISKFQVNQKHIYFRGICEACLNNQH